MDLDRSPTESTAVIKMKQHFAEFLSHSSTTSKSMNVEDSQCKKLNFSDMSDNSITIMTSPLVTDKEHKVQKMAAELLSARSTISQLQTKLTCQETDRKRGRFELESKLESARQGYQDEQDKYAEALVQLKFVKERGDRYSEMFNEAKKEHQDKINEMETHMQAVLTSKENVILELQKEHERLHEEVSALKSESVHFQAEAFSACEQASARQVEFDASIRKLSEECKKKCEDYKIQVLKSSHVVKEVEEKLKRYEEDNKMSVIMKSQLTSIPALENQIGLLREENLSLRESHDNVRLLKECIDGLQKKCKRLEDRCLQFDKVHLENEELKKTVGMYQQSNGDLQKPSSLKKQIAELQNNELMMMEKNGVLQSSLHSTVESLKLDREKLSKLANDHGLVQSKCQQQADLIKRLQRKLLLITKERDGYKRIIDSYESEVTVSLDATTTSRLTQQEEVIQGYRLHNEQAEAEIQRQAAELNTYKAKCQLMEAQDKQVESDISLVMIDQRTVVSLREKVASLESAMEKLNRERDVYEARLEQLHLQGDYDPTTTKVIHLSQNPAAQAHRHKQNQLDSLKEENEKLKERVKLLEESPGTLDNITLQVEQNLHYGGPAHSQELERKLETAELKNKRLMEAFKKTSQEFRTVVYQLTGYQINIKTSNQFQLMSMYAESPADILLFQQSKNGEMQLLSTDFSSTLSTHVEMYLERHDSIPCFLSNVTLDLFGRQTMQL